MYFAVRTEELIKLLKLFFFSFRGISGQRRKFVVAHSNLIAWVCFVLLLDPDEVIYDDVPRENSDSEPGLKAL